MSTPFLALAPFIPRVVEVPYQATLLVCDCTDCTDSSDFNDSAPDGDDEI